jgi:hypothetical protein
MKIFLAGSGLTKVWQDVNFYDFFRLQTFFHITPKEASEIFKYKDFLLDSGAFSFIGGAKVSMKEYIEDYINFINKYDIKKFFELDLYTLPEYGIKKTEEIRAYIELKTGKKSIPVFHKMLGIDYYKQLCEDYNYIAIGASGMHDSKWTRNNPKQLKDMVLYAKSKNVKVHGLGYTKIDMLKEIPFYSVDSTSWLSGNRFGSIYVFNGSGFDKKNKPLGMRVKTDMTAQNNFYEWIKFQKYANEKF